MADVARQPRGRKQPSSGGGGVVGGASGGGSDRDPPKGPGKGKPGREHEKEKANLPKVTKQTLAQSVKKGNSTEDSLVRLAVKDSATLQFRSTNAQAGAYDLNNILYRVPLIAHVRADDNEQECGHCNNQNGPLSACRSIPGYFGDACTNCAFGGHQNRCSMYTGAPPASRARSSARSTASSQRTIVSGSSKPRTLYNPGVSTSNANQLERQAATLREQAEANEARARALRAGEHVRTWSNDSSFKGFGDNNNEEEEEEFHGFSDDEMQE